MRETIFEATNLMNLMKLEPELFKNIPLSQEIILSWFEACDAVWLHNGDPTKPHAELTSGMCSNGFFDCLRVLCHPNLNEILAYELAKRMVKEGLADFERVDWVIGSPYAAITFSYEVAKALDATHMFCEKDPADPKGKKMLWKRLTIPESATVLQIEELITTSGTMQEVRRAIKEGNEYPVNFLPVVGTLAHRPPKLPVDYGEQQVVALVEKEIWAVPPEECPLCKAGSVRYRPKTHWRELTGKN